MEIFISFTFDASHGLPNTPEEHKCHQLHGHTFRAEVHLTGKVDPHTGWVIDFADLKRICAPLIAQLDHGYLNNVEGLENPTSENIAMWLWRRLKPRIETLSKIVVQETACSGAVYHGEDE